MRSSSHRSLQLITVLSLLVGPALGWTGAASMAAAAESVPAQVAAPSVTEPRSTGTAEAEAQSYEAREAQSKSLENFKGGEPVVIYTSTAVLIVALIILVVLI